MAKLLKDLPVGSLVKDEGSKYYGKPIVWRVLDHDHPGYPSGSTTLLTDKIISLKAYDASEPTNPNYKRERYGNNRDIHSNIRAWLHSAETNWYESKHLYDAPPTKKNVLLGENPYDTEKGFMANLTANLRETIMPTTLKVLKNDGDGGELESFTDKVFLLSSTEVDRYNDTSHKEGTQFNYFKSGSDRVAYPTKEAIENSTHTSYDLSTSKGWYWLLRTPEFSYENLAYVFLVKPTGLSGNTLCASGTEGVRPALNLDSGVLVSDSPDSDDVYTIMWNQPPTTPDKIIVNEPVVSDGYVSIQWESSTDPEGDDISYVLEKKSNGGEWKQVYQGADNSNRNWVARTENAVQYRVKAYDVHGNESGWRSSTIKQVVHNRPPKISGEDKDLGVQTRGFEVPYTVSDEDGDKVTVVVRLNDKELSRESIQLDKEYKVDFTGENFLTIPDGEHQLIIQATDANDATTTRRYTFSRAVNETTATLKEPLLSQDRISQAIMSVAGQVDELNFKIEATNNGFDAEPVWIDVTKQVLTGRKIFFDNQVATAGKFGYNFKLTLMKSEQPAYIRSVGGNFE